MCCLQVTTASKNQGRHAQSVEDIIRVCMQSTVFQALHSAYMLPRDCHAFLWHGDCSLYCLQIPVTPTAAVLCQHASFPALLLSSNISESAVFKSDCTSATKKIRLGLEILSSLQIAHPIQCSCMLAPTCWTSTQPLPFQKSLHLGAGARHGHCSSFKAEQKLGWAAC